MKRVALIVMVFGAIGLIAQQRPQQRNEIPRIGETIDVSIVNVEVFVTDKAGRRVTGLTKEDFEIREEGKLKPITNFIEYGPEESDDRVSVDAVTGSQPAAPRRARRAIVIFIEKQYLWREHRDDFYASLKSLLDSSMDEGDEAMIVSWNFKTVVTQPMTNDRAALHKALDAMARTTVPSQADPARQAREEMIADREFEQSLGGRFDTSSPGNADIACGLMEMERIRRKTHAITSVINSLGGFENARKVLIMATRRFGAHAGIDCFTGQLSLDQRMRLRTDDLRNALVAAANANGVTIYPIHPEDLQTSTISITARHAAEGAPQMDLGHTVMLNEMEAARDIAARTGGLAEWGPDVVKLLPRIEDDLSSYYSLGYSANGAMQDRSRSITVSVKRPGLTVRSRKQYVEKSPATQMRDRVVANLAYGVDGASIDVDVEVGDIRRDSKRRFSVPVKVRVPIAALTTVPSGSEAKGAFSVYIAAGGAVLSSDVTDRTKPFSIPLRDLENAKRSHFTFEAQVAVDDKTDAVSIGVIDEVGRDFGLARVDMRGRTTATRAR